MSLAFSKPDLEKLGMRLQDARLSSHMTQEEVAETCGVTSKHISCVERGQVGPSLPLMAILCRLYRVSADLILEGLLAEGLPRRKHRRNKKRGQDSDPE